LELTLSILDLPWQEIEAKIARFTKDYVEKACAKGVVLGLSGGIDSSTTAALSALALGGKNILGLVLPEEETRNTQDIDNAKSIAKKFGFKTELIDITPALESFYKTTPIFDAKDNVSRGNVKARMRMIYIYYYANKLGRLVCGSSDKSETMMGYFTKWGDVAADISPLMDLYKTQVRNLAKHLGVPKKIIEQAPSPNLWPGQLAENELVIKYEQLDLVLYGLEHFMKTKEIARQLGMKEELVNKIKNRWFSTEHKRRLLLTAKLEYRTVGADFRLPRSSG